METVTYVLAGGGTFGRNQVKAEKGDVLLLDSLTETAEFSEITFQAAESLRVEQYAERLRCTKRWWRGGLS